MGGILLEPGRSTSGANAASRAALMEASRALIAGLDLLARQRFVALEFVGDDGNRDRDLRPAELRPTWLRRQLRSAARPFAHHHRARRERAGPGLSAAATGSQGRRSRHVVGEVSPGFLWGTVDLSMPSRSTRLVVLDDSAHVLFSSSKTALASRTAMTQTTRALLEQLEATRPLNRTCRLPLRSG